MDGDALREGTEAGTGRWDWNWDYKSQLNAYTQTDRDKSSSVRRMSGEEGDGNEYSS